MDDIAVTRPSMFPAGLPHSLLYPSDALAFRSQPEGRGSQPLLVAEDLR